MSVIYRSPSQNNSEFDSFLSNLGQLLRDISTCNPTVSVITGDLMQDLRPGGLKISILQKEQNYICLHPQTGFRN